MKRYILTPRARVDLDDIWRYTAANWDAIRAERYLREIQRSIEAVTDNPLLGRSCDEIREGYRRHPAGSHIIFYRLSGSTIEIVRILHARMDFQSRF